LTPPPGAEGAGHRVLLRRLVEQHLCLHPAQQHQRQNNLPAYTVGRLRAHVPGECRGEGIRDWVSSDEPQAHRPRFSNALHAVVAGGRSKQQRMPRPLGRLAPPPFLTDRAEEVMRTMPVLST
jgi:hypothetical protein